MSDALLTVREVITKLRIPRSTWYQCAKLASAARYQASKRWLRIRRSALDEWLDSLRVRRCEKLRGGIWDISKRTIEARRGIGCGGPLVAPGRLSASFNGGRWQTSFRSELRPQTTGNRSISKRAVIADLRGGIPLPGMRTRVRTLARSGHGWRKLAPLTVESLTAVTMVLVRQDRRGRPSNRLLREALYLYWFNPRRWSHPVPKGHAAALTWIERASLPVTKLSRRRRCEGFGCVVSAPGWQAGGCYDGSPEARGLLQRGGYAVSSASSGDPLLACNGLRRR